MIFDLINDFFTLSHLRIFFILFFGGVICSLGLATSVNTIHAAVFLVGIFANVGCMFLYLNLEFISIIIIIVYVGAITILFLFVIMMLNIKIAEYTQTFFGQKSIIFLLFAFYFFELVILFNKANFTITNFNTFLIHASEIVLPQLDPSSIIEIEYNKKLDEMGLCTNNKDLYELILDEISLYTTIGLDKASLNYNYQQWLRTYYTFSNMNVLSIALFDFYFVPFIICGCILFIAMIGAITIINKEETKLLKKKKQNHFKQTYRSIKLKKKIIK